MRRIAIVPLVTLGLGAVVFAAQWTGTQPPPDHLADGFEAITEQDAKRHLEYLAGPETQGRGSGQPGYQKAAEYVAARFKEYGLKPGGENGTYFQHGSLYRSHVDSGYVRVGGETVKAGKDLNFGEVYHPASGEAPIVLLRVRDKGSDLPEGTNLKGAIVLLSGPGVDASIRIDVRQQDPKMILNVRSDVPKTVWSIRQRAPERVRLQGTISETAAGALAKAGGYTGFVSGINGLVGPFQVKTLGQASFDLKVTSGEVKVPNVIGILPGTDASVGQEHVALGAHLDHMGTDGEQTWWGADDDGSGSTALIEAAKAFSKNPRKPKRSVVFLAFYGEEMGLIGSTLYVNNPVLPIEKMVAEFQMDMVGRNSYGIQNGDPNRVDKEEENRDTMRLVGSKRLSTELHQAVLDANRHVGFRFLYDSEDLWQRSDHYVFASRGVPIAFLFDGFTPDYHQPTDTVDKINFTKLANAARLFYLAAFDVANRDKPVAKDVKE
ncbi:MAG TPA: M28 family peptidase [Fimbriimonas sp.]